MRLHVVRFNRDPVLFLELPRKGIRCVEGVVHERVAVRGELDDQHGGNFADKRTDRGPDERERRASASEIVLVNGEETAERQPR